ncbi:MAG: peptide chain release factor N(5)-glutamine methyltransferase [Lachnospiraceae bacterium]|nr:peptide chain release factor N(5)-glutamine methyltransferase [Lachnospiraceae bacterium]
MSMTKYSRDWDLIPMTDKELFELAKKSINSPEAESDALILFEYVTGKDRMSLYLHPEEEETQEKKEKLLELIKRRNTGEPVQYITGKTYFYGLEFLCDKDTLIPRFDTEVLTQEAIKSVPRNAGVLDMCTGTGCIIIALKHERNDITAFGSDISEKAILTARKNAQLNECNVEFTVSDMFRNIDGRFDVIISNPPYIERKVIDELDATVKEYEPFTALCGGEDGLDYYRIIAKEAHDHLLKDGSLLLEIGYDQGKSVPEILSAEGFVNIKVIKDLNGLDRVVSAVFGG